MEDLSDFDFYLKFTKPLVLGLPKTIDKALAAAWIKKLMDESIGDDQTRLTYLKLLLFVLQRKTMVPPFTEHPNTIETLTPMSADKTMLDVARDMLAQEQAEKIAKAKQRLQGECGDYPPYISDFSADLMEYVAVQNIEQFGVHGYYAISKIPINTWYNVDMQLLPKAAKSMIEVSPGPAPMLGTSSEPSLPVSPQVPEGSPQPTEQTEEGEPEAGETEPEPGLEPEPDAEASSPSSPPSGLRSKSKSPRKSTMGATPPSRPIGKKSPPSEDRKPPTWGSNLLEVKNIIEEIEESNKSDSPKTDYIMKPDRFDDMSEFEDMAFSPPSYHGSPDFLSASFLEAEGLDTSFQEMGDYLPQEFSPQQRFSPQPGPSTASIPRITVTPPSPGYKTPPLPKKKLPKIKTTRSAMLLAKKKQELLKPPSPPPPKKPVRKPRPVPKAKPVPKEEAPPPADKKGVKTPGRKSLGKKTSVSKATETEEEGKKKAPGKKKSVTKKTPKRVESEDLMREAVSEIIAQLSPGDEAFRGFTELDDIDDRLAEYQKMLKDMEDKYREDQEEYKRKYGGQKSVIEAAKPKGIPRPKRSLSKIAKKSKIAIPKRHDVSIPIEKSIHISPEARETLTEYIEMPSPTTGEQRVSSISHPMPRLSPDLFVEEEPSVEDFAEEIPFENEEEEEEEEAIVEPRPVKKPIAPGKNMRMSEFYQRMMATSRMMSPIAEEQDEDDLDMGQYGDADMEVNFADISGRGQDLDQVLQELEQAQQGGDVSHLVADFEASPEQQVQAQDMTTLQTAPAPQPDFDDFEAMERMVEEEMQREGQDPRARRKKVKVTKKSLAKGRKRFLEAHAKADAQMAQISSPRSPSPARRTPPRDFDPGLYFADMPQQQFEGMDDEQWISGPEFFKDQQTGSPRRSPRQDPRAKPPQALFPNVDFNEEEDEEDFLSDDMLDMFMSESPPTTPDRQFKKMKEVEDLYFDLLQSSPGLAGIPITVPRPTTSPRREPVDFNEINFTPPQSPEDTEFGLPVVEKHSNVDLYVKGVKKFAEKQKTAKQTPKKRTPPRIRTPSPSPPPSQDYEGDVSLTYPPEDMGEMDDEEFYYVSPERIYHELKKVSEVDTSGVSPPRKEWYTDAKKITKNLWGTPEKIPDVFDFPAERLAGETPPRLASPERSPLSPPIDASALREHIRIQPRLRVQLPYKRRVGAKTMVRRYSHPSRSLRPVQELPVKESLTQEDLDLQEELKKAKKKKRGREIFRFPMYKKRKFIQRHAPPPRLSPVKEVMEPTPPRKGGSVYDLPDTWGRVLAESPPDTFFETPWVSPPVSPEDPEAWKENVREQPGVPYDAVPYSRTVGKGRHRVERRSAPPRLQPVSELIERATEEDWELRNIIGQQPGRLPPKDFGRIRRPPGLRALGEQIEDYPPSPVSSRQIPGSPRGGPRRRELRKKLKKRKIDFSQPMSPDEGSVEVEQIETDVGGPERQFYDLSDIPELSPGVYAAVESPYRPGSASPRTPTSRLLDVEMEPEVMDELIELTPPSPMSRREAFEQLKQEISGHQMQPRRKPRRKIRDMMRQRRLLEKVEERPQEEAVARIHDEVEREVEEELAAREREIYERERHLVDEPIPAGLPSPMKPQKDVPFYKTPPHLKRPPTPKKEPKINIWPSQFRDVLKHEEMPDLVEPNDYSPPDEYDDRYYSPPPLATETEDFHTPEIGEEGMPTGMASPVSPTITSDYVKQMADWQYAMLASPETIKYSPEERMKQQRAKVNLLGVEVSPDAIDDNLFEDEVDFDEIDVMESPSPVKRIQQRSPQPGPSWMPDDIEYEYVEIVDEPKSSPGSPMAIKTAVQYDMDAFEKLGVTEQDLQQVNLNDAPSRSPDSPEARNIAQMYEQLKQTDSRMTRRPMKVKGRYLPTRYKYLAQDLGTVPESADENKPPSPMGWNMRWDLSPESRVNMRAPDVQVEHSPIKKSRFEFEEVKLESPPRPEYHRLLPLVIPREEAQMYPLALDFDIGMERVDLGLSHEEEPEDLIQHTPPPPPYKSPEPVSPSKLRGELEMHEYYDPDRKRMRKTVKVKGKSLRLMSKPPGLSTIHERTPPRRVELRPPTQSVAEVMEMANRQYAELMSNRPLPSPKTPSPDTFKYKVQKHKFQPRLYHKKFTHLAAKGSELTPPKEMMERLYVDAPTPKREPPMEMLVPQDAERIATLTPPLDYYMFGEEEEEEGVEDFPGEMGAEDMWEQEGPDEVSPVEYYSPSPPGSPAEELGFGEDIFEQELQGMSPPFVVEEEETVEEQQDDFYKQLLPSPIKPERLYQRPRSPSPEGFGLPTVANFQQLPETPKRRMKKGAQRRPGRRLQFQRSPTASPETPEGPHVTTLTVEAQIHSQRTPVRRPPTPPPLSPIDAEEMPSMIEEIDVIESYRTPPGRQNMAPFGGRTSPGMWDTSPIHYEENIPEHLQDFKWMDVDKM